MKFIHSFCFIALILIFSSCFNKSTNDFSVQQFKTPPNSVHVHTWWHWIDGRITKDGITKDLESMKKQGISQATILNIGMGAKDSGVKRISFNTEEWYDMFQWALHEADRLGIIIGIHNCDGWSESGGPWITPEMSMKKFVYSKTIFSEGMGTVKLPKPFCDTDFYRDVAVIAYKKEKTSIWAQQTKIIKNDSIDGSMLVDGDPESMSEVLKDFHFLIENPSGETKTKVAFIQNFKGAFYHPGPKTIEYTLSSSNDGKHFKKIKSIETNKFYTVETLEFPPNNARFFEFRVSKIRNLRPWHHAALSELQLVGENEEPRYRPTVLYPLEKSASARIIEQKKLYTSNVSLETKNIISKKNIIDISSNMSPDGTLKWKKPEGNWTIIRFGYTTTGATNGPATPEGRGLECDKMDTAAVNLHFRNFPQKLIDKAAEYTGNTFKFFLIDSWERGYQTWTKHMPEEFEKYRGYNLMEWIPVLCGETVESTDLSEGFLYDFRKTVADLFEHNYYEHFNHLCHQNGMDLHGEVMYGDNGPFPPVDVLRTNDCMDMPMYEFWADINRKQMVEYKPVKERIKNFPAYVPNFYNKPLVGSEAYTGFAHYSESPADLKLFGDRAYCSGINQMILHSYVHQPGDKKPGITLGRHGSHFNRQNPYWNYSKEWLDYHSRIQYILQKGGISSDILYYLGEQLPQFFGNKTIKALPDGYQSVPCNLDVLKQLKVKNGRLYFSEAQQFSILILPDEPVLCYDALVEIERLLKDGAIIYGNKPFQMFSLEDRKTKTKNFEELVASMWQGYFDKPGRNSYGKGMLIWQEPIDNLLAEYKLKPDFITNQADSLNLMYIHKNTAHSEMFFVFNQQNISFSRECIFNVTGLVPSIWNPLTGEVKKVTVYAEEDGQTRIPVTFHPKESLFFIFTNEEVSEHICKIESDNQQIFPLAENLKDIHFPKITNSADGEWLCFDKASRDYSFTTNNDKTISLTSKMPETLKLEKFKGKITFNSLNTNNVNSIEISNFRSFTDFEQNDIKYFAGTADYQIDFDVPQTFINQKNVSLCFGNFDASGEVYLNGQLVGQIWLPGSSFQVGTLLKAHNNLEIKLATTCRNRFIGDFKEYGEVRNLWTSAPVKNFLKKDSELKPSGIIEPIRLVKYE